MPIELPSLNHIQRIALIKPSALGDIIHALPVLHALRIRFPAAKITWIVNKGYQSLLSGHPEIDEILPFDRGMFRGSLFKMLPRLKRFIDQLRQRRFDLALDLQGLFRSGLMTRYTLAPYRFGFSNAREGATWFYSHVIPTPPLREQHAVDRNWVMAEALGISSVGKKFILPENHVAAEWAKTALEKLPRPWLCFSVGSRWETKRWFPEHYAKLAQMAQQKYGGTVIFVGSPDEAVLSEQVACQLRGKVWDCTGKTSFPQLIALLRKIDAMVANDSGPLHLATALARPVVAPYTCTRVQLHGPYEVNLGAIATTVACAGSYIKTCSRMDCMRDLTPDKLWPILNEVLATCQYHYHSA